MMGSTRQQPTPGIWQLGRQSFRRKSIPFYVATALLLFCIAVYWDLLPFQSIKNFQSGTGDHVDIEKIKGSPVIITTSNVAGTSTPSIAGATSITAPSNAAVIGEYSRSSTTWRSLPTLGPEIGDHPPLLPNVDDPNATDAQNNCPGYTASHTRHESGGFTALLTLAGKACNVYGTDVESLNLTVQYESVHRLSIKITPTYLTSSNITQYYIPDYYVREPYMETGEDMSEHNDLQLTWSNDPTFSFKVRRQSTNDVLFDTTGTVLVFEDQFVEFKTTMPENYNLYGLGERMHSLRLGNDFVATIWAADVGDPEDFNVYGSHPFYLDTRYYSVDTSTGDMSLLTKPLNLESEEYVSYSHGVYLRNTHGQEVALKPKDLTWRLLGGSIELYFFSGPSQHEVTSQYVNVIGLPMMQQYFAFGYHQCRWGYESWAAMKEVVQNMREAEIPMESIWTDLDYMLQYRDFENDPNRYSYAEGKEFLAQLHEKHQHWIPIVDSAIYIPNPDNETDAYPTYTRGNESGAFMTNHDEEQYIGAVWPGFTVFPDWHAPGTQGWWTKEIMLWHEKVAFSGIWLDMSEVASFCLGSCGSGRVKENPVHPPFSLPGEVDESIVDGDDVEGSDSANARDDVSAAMAAHMEAPREPTRTATAQATTSYLRTTPTPGVRNVTYPPYVIKNFNGPLGGHAVSPDARHVDGTEEYDMHNLFGHEIMNATYNALLDLFPNKRPFIIGRSTFAGSGSFAGHWGGDNTATWAQMRLGIPQALSFSLYGIPMFGVDTCGFAGNTTEELCNRWMQLSAFFTFYRNHNVLSAESQEPYRWPSVAEASKKAMHIRYSLLPYIYTLFYHAHNTGSTVVRALSWEFLTYPDLRDADRQFLVGPAIMVTPVLEQSATTVNGIFPGENTKWYDWYTLKAVTASWNENVTIDAPLGHIPVYIRGGYILPIQAPGYTTTECRQNNWTLIVALDANGTAAGDLYLDDGESHVPETTRNVEFDARDGSLQVSSEGSYAASQPLSHVTVLGISEKPEAVRFNGEVGVEWTYDEMSKVLNVTGLKGYTRSGAWTEEWNLSWQ